MEREKWLKETYLIELLQQRSRYLKLAKLWQINLEYPVLLLVFLICLFFYEHFIWFALSQSSRCAACESIALKHLIWALSTRSFAWNYPYNQIRASLFSGRRSEHLVTNSATGLNFLGITYSPLTSRQHLGPPQSQCGGFISFFLSWVSTIYRPWGHIINIIIIHHLPTTFWQQSG